MKFLVVTNHSYMLWQFRRELIARLLELGEVILSMPFVGHEEDFARMGCRCIETKLERRSINPATDLELYRFYHRLIRTERPDMVLTYSIKPNIYAGYACSRLGVPYCTNIQGLGTPFEKRGLAELVSLLHHVALRKSGTVFFENGENADLFVRRRIIPRSKVTVLHGAGVNLDYYTFRPYPSEEEGIRFLYLGRIMREKGVDELFSAARRLKAEYGDRVHFDLVGFFEEEYTSTVEQLAQEGIVKFHGFRQDPRPYYAAAHCVVLPSYHEGMSNVLLESAATGRALITTDVSGCREAVRDGVSGFLCAPRSEQSLYDRMHQFLELSPEQRAAMGRAGRTLMEESFDKNGVVDKTLRQILAHCKGTAPAVQTTQS
ncbi:MAG: glycosyltransferase family 4 protein [Gemmiger sp.]|uniref:glycosyltransferase family 4 protein n=1 Tax=Gemmiger sp. TaxID=2049027 RepID=UPI002E767BB8|nr:glycosyltransferase family 4 protein [Gemmiger sp.]MEE0801570.1 glycosyltransferase family 4 protein [Gemmiger sp.]